MSNEIRGMYISETNSSKFWYYFKNCYGTYFCIFLFSLATHQIIDIPPNDFDFTISKLNEIAVNNSINDFFQATFASSWLQRGYWSLKWISNLIHSRSQEQYESGLEAINKNLYKIPVIVSWLAIMTEYAQKHDLLDWVYTSKDLIAFNTLSACPFALILCRSCKISHDWSNRIVDLITHVTTFP